MAKQKSHIKYTGSLGEIRHFKIKGKEGYFAGLKGGVDKNVIMSDPKFARTRENMQEFAGAAKAGKALRQGFPQLMKQMGGAGYTGKITGAMKRIMNADTLGARGSRTVSVITNPQLLQGFEINANRPFSMVCRVPIDLSINTDRNEVSMTMDAFAPNVMITWPDGATHFKLILGVATIADYVYEASRNEYVPVNPAFDQLKVSADGGFMPLQGMVTTPPTVVGTLPTGAPVPADVAVVTATAIEFTQEVNGVMYPLSDGHAMQLARVL